jgi:hypothetical protein
MAQKQRTRTINKWISKLTKKLTTSTSSRLTSLHRIGTKNAKDSFQISIVTTRRALAPFSHSWEGEVSWICPPIKEVFRIVKRLRASKTSGVLFVPEWKNADYWVEIFDTEGFLLWPFKFVETHRPFIIQNKLDHRSPLTGRTKFNFLAFFIEFDSNWKTFACLLSLYLLFNSIQ